MQTEDRKAESEVLDWPEVEDDDAIWYRPLLEGYGIYAFTVYDADIETWVFDETFASETELKRHERTQTLRRPSESR